MTPSRSRFVTACQQLLALAVVLAVLTPAASLVTLDVVGSAPTGPTATSLAHPTARTAAYTAEAVRPSKVPTAPVTPIVREVQLTSADATIGRTAPATSAARVVAQPGGASRLTTTPQSVTGFGEVGVSWAHGVTLPQSASRVAARTRTQGTWSAWHTIPYDPEHGPDPGSAEARHARPGTDPLLVGKVGRVQVRAVSRRPLPADMKLAVISPGKATHTASEHAALDTSTMDGDNGADSVYRAVDPQPVGGDSAQLAAAVFTPRPVIYSRAQWGADERMRSKSSLHYGDVHAGFVHHTVNANNYTRAEVPALLRSIYAYHVRVRGWSDIGYNYLIDRFGRIWEGRYGGIDRAVVGAHTLGFNDDSFAAVGDRQLRAHQAEPGDAAGLRRAVRLEALAARRRRVVHAAVRHDALVPGHQRPPRRRRRPPARGSTSTTSSRRSGRWPQPTSAAGAGGSSSPTSPRRPRPDIVVRRASDGEAFVVPTGGLIHFPAPTTVATGVTGATAVLVSRDLTGDGRGDLLVRQSDGSLAVRPGTSTGTYAATDRVLTAFRGKDQVIGPRRPQRRRARRPRGPQPRHRGPRAVSSSVQDGTFRHVAAGTSWNCLRPDLGGRRPDRRRHTGPGGPRPLRRPLDVRRRRPCRLRAAGPGARELRLLRQRHRWWRPHPRRAPRSPRPTALHGRHLHPAGPRRRHLRPPARALLPARPGHRPGGRRGRRHQRSRRGRSGRRPPSRPG